MPDTVPGQKQIDGVPMPEAVGQQAVRGVELLAIGAVAIGPAVPLSQIKAGDQDGVAVVSLAGGFGQFWFPVAFKQTVIRVLVTMEGSNPQPISVGNVTLTGFRVYSTVPFSVKFHWSARGM